LLLCPLLLLLRRRGGDGHRTSERQAVRRGDGKGRELRESQRQSGSKKGVKGFKGTQVGGGALARRWRNYGMAHPSNFDTEVQLTNFFKIQF